VFRNLSLYSTFLLHCVALAAMPSTKEPSSSLSFDSSDAKDYASSWPKDICQPCRAMFSENYEGQTGPHHSSIESLEQSVLIGCYICCYIWSKVAKDEDFISDATRSPYTDFTLRQGWHTESRHLDFKVAGSTKVFSFLLFPSSSVASRSSKTLLPFHLLIDFRG
jgi:hypothetical protein